MSIELNRRSFLKTTSQTALGTTALALFNTAKGASEETPGPSNKQCETDSAREIVRLRVPLASVYSPADIYSPATNGGALITQPDGVIRFFYRLYQPGETATSHEGSGSTLYEDRSDDGGQTWRLGLEVMKTGEGSRYDVAYLNPYTGEIYLFYMRGPETFLRKTTKNCSVWLPEVSVPFPCVWDSFGFAWLKSRESSGAHRLVVVSTIRQGSGSETKAEGTASFFSDDDGATWVGPSNLVTTKPFPGRWRNPSTSGQLVELSDGRLWMLTRSSQDHLWEAYSEDRGKSWTKIGPSRFVGVFSNVRLQRISGDRLLMVWLNSMPHSGLPKENSFHNTDRDVLHAAISLDDGASWRGFREVVLDRNRNTLNFEPEPAFDAGVHHPKFTVTQGGKVIVMTGQDDDHVTWGSPHRRAVVFDPQWLLDEERRTDFSTGLDELCTARLSAMRWSPTNYYARAPGARIAAHPTEQFRNVLQLGREPGSWLLNEQAGATWNFPTGIRGRIETRILLRDGFKGASIALTDAYYNPSDVAGEANAVFCFEIPENGALGDSTLSTNCWYDISVEWPGTQDADNSSAKLYVDGVLQSKPLPLRRPSINGINYVRFRSTAPSLDVSGFLVDYVHVRVIW